MATTRIMPVHPIKNWGAAQTVKYVTDYVKNPAKTEGGLLVTGFECDPDVVTEDFMLQRDEYQFNTGREQGANEILCYHARQSFLPGEADAETVAKLGYELAMELTGGKFSFIVCTHTDKPHLHNHIIINAVNLDCDRKFRNELYSYKRIRRTADRISAAHDLSVVENPKLSKGTANRYDKPTKRDTLVELIDDFFAISPPKDFDDMLKQLAKNGCKIKRRGKTISVQPSDAERYFRFRTGKKGMPDGYDEESLRKKIAEIQAGLQSDLHEDMELKLGENVADAHANTHGNISTDTHSNTLAFDDFSSVEDKDFTLNIDTLSSDMQTEPPTMPASEPSSKPSPALTSKPTIKPTSKITHDKKINLIIDIENSIKAQENVGYERRAHGFNLQQAAETLLFLQTNNLTDMDALTLAVSQAQAEYDALQKRITAADIRIKEVNTLQRHIGAYNKNKDVHSHYLRTKRNTKYRTENEKAIAIVEEAKAFFDSLGLEKLPTIKDLQAEYSVLSQEKHNCYQARTEMRRHVSDLQSAKKNAEILLGVEVEPVTEQRKTKGQIDER